MLKQEVFFISTAFSLVFAAPSYTSNYYEYQPLVKFPCGEDVNKWIAPISIGNPAQNFDVVLDTSTSDVWVAGVKCHSPFCENQPESLYNAGESSTSVDLHKEVVLRYLQPDDSVVEVAGELYDDDISFSGATFKNLTFAKAFDVKGWESESDFAGYFGLGYSDNTLTKRSLLVKRAARGPTMTGLQRFAGGRKRNNDQCVVSLGIDYTAVIGKVAWLPPPSCAVDGPSSWKTDLSCVEVKGVVDIKLDDAVASFDTNVKSFQIPKNHLDKIYSALGATRNESTDNYEFKCCYAADLKFSFDKYNIVIPVSEWTKKIGSDEEYCTADFEETPEALGTKQWNFGQSFFKNFYFLYDSVARRTGIAITHVTAAGTSISSK